jgi:hypothetical protein
MAAVDVLTAQLELITSSACVQASTLIEFGFMLTLTVSAMTALVISLLTSE